MAPKPETSPETASDQAFVSRVVEAAVRLAVIAVLAMYSYRILAPFLHMILWAGIVAVAVYPMYLRLLAALGTRRRLAAVLFTLLMLLVLATPATLLVRTLVSGASELASGLSSEEQFEIPPPPESVARWPLVGERVHSAWLAASKNLAKALEPIRPQLREFGGWLLGAGAGAGLGILKFVASLIIAGVLLAHAEGAGRTIRSVLVRLAGPRGAEMARLMEATVRSVARGVLGVAFIQATLAGLGFLVVGLPFAGLWALAALLLAIVQLGVGLVTIPAVIYVFFTADTLTASLFLAWNLVVSVLDNVLKPLLLGRGVSAPMLVIFIGSVGGFLAAGILGLFVGAVILVLAHNLLMAWLDEPAPEAGAAPAE